MPSGEFDTTYTGAVISRRAAAIPGVARNRVARCRSAISLTRSTASSGNGASEY